MSHRSRFPELDTAVDEAAIVLDEAIPAAGMAPWMVNTAPELEASLDNPKISYIEEAKINLARACILRARAETDILPENPFAWTKVAETAVRRGNKRGHLHNLHPKSSLISTEKRHRPTQLQVYSKAVSTIDD